MRPLMLPQPAAPRAAFGKLVHNEMRLAWRQPAGLIASVGVALLLVIIFGEVPSLQQPSVQLGGLSAFEVYVPILIAFVIGVLALAYLPGPLVSYREQGILRRLSTTPVPPSWLLGAQLAVQACLMVATVGVLLIVSAGFFGLSAPKNLPGLALAVALSMAGMFAIGLVIAAVARTSGAARGLMAAAFYPLMFFAGLYVPVQVLPAALRGISHYSPLGAAVQAIQDSMFQGFPPAAPLLALAAYAVAFGLLARRFFRWE
jgi:ABC-2 type transport system permease protein